MDAADALALVVKIHTRLNARRPEIENCERYYKGEQPLSFATTEWKKANAARFSGFSDNWCGPVVNASSERIKYTGIKIAANPAGAKVLHEQWLLSELEAQSSQGFVTTLTTARSFVIVWGDPSTDEPTVTWEHPSQVEIEYDFENPNLRRAALKTWMDDEREYATLYTPTELYKFQRTRPTKDKRQSQARQSRARNVADGGWVPRESASEPWPIPNNMGVVPVVEIKNRPTLMGDPVSEISGVMSMQDAINLLWAYLFHAADYASMPARVATGTKPPMMPILDDTGKRIGEKPVEMRDLAEKRLLFLTGDNAKIDSWEAAKLDVFTDTIEIAIGHIAAQTRTPPTYLATNKGISNVNGDGLKASEIGLNKKVGEFQTFTDPAMREIFRLIALAKGDEALARQARFATITWMNPEIRSEAQMADALLKKKQMGYPLEYLMELDGIDPVTIERVLAMREAELNDPQLAAATRELTNLADPQRVG